MIRTTWRDVPELVAMWRSLTGQRAIDYAGANDVLDAVRPDRHREARRQLVIGEAA